MLRVYSRLAAAAAISLLVSVHLTHAQDQRQNEPGQFDFYVLALSWSPSYCASARERAPDRAPDQQCGERPYSFVVHGLWPQYESGFPEYCKRGGPRPDRNLVSGMLDVMPSPRLILHEWDRHGTCSGQNPRAYFDTVRKARAAVKIPLDYLELKQEITVTPDELEDAFVKANPGLTRDAIAVGCDSRRVNEVRICLGKDFGFRGCAEVDRRACRRDKLVMPPSRGSVAETRSLSAR
jgi:ribonuclease T2